MTQLFSSIIRIKKLSIRFVFCEIYKVFIKHTVNASSILKFNYPGFVLLFLIISIFKEIKNILIILFGIFDNN